MTTNPMLAGKLDPKHPLRFPVLASPKIDGIRLRVMRGVAMSRSMKPLPNLYLQKFFAKHGGDLNGLDGEVVVGNPTDPDCYVKTASGIMSEDGMPDFTFLVFDYMNSNPFKQRLEIACGRALAMEDRRVRFHNHTLITDFGYLDEFEAEQLALGYEGIMTRDPNGLYKSGRSTAKEQGLLKIKRFEDAEAKIIGVEELMHNDNPAETNELGRTKRSSHQENKVGTGTLGALVCRGTNGEFAGVVFNVGTGFSAAQRSEFWLNDMTGKTITYKYFPVGVKDKPRHPVFKGFRND